MTVYYKVFEEWCKYPFQDVLDESYCLFSFSRKKFKEIEGVRINSDTSIKQKEDYLKVRLDLKTVKVQKI